MGKKFVAVSCHDDIIEWLQPDWLYDTNQQIFYFRNRNEKRPEIKVDVYDTTETQSYGTFLGNITI